jgi:flagellar basal-body rod protein FlgG
MRALHTAATGMMAQELNVQVISNNIANMRTTGYKRQRAEFQDLLYEHVSRIGTQTSTQGNILPVGIDLGGGVKTVGTPRVMTQGTLSPTGRDFDVAIRGDGFFKIVTPDGTFAYTRDGSFQMDAQGRVVTAKGNVVQPGITIPPNSTSVTINAQGQVSAIVSGSTSPTVLGQLTLTRFVNKAGLQPIGDNLYLETPASGTPQDGQANTDGLGDLQQGNLEQANVEAVTEISDLIAAQRAYEMNAKVITAADQMLQSTSAMMR